MPADRLGDLLPAIRGCRICADTPAGPPLPHEPRPIFQISATARVAILSQAPGNLAHQKGKPFADPSGVRLRHWLGLDEPTFYDASRVAIIPMGFCFPGYDKNGGDRPPRKECAATWHDRVFAALPRLTVRLCIGKSSLNYHLPQTRRQSLTETVKAWRDIVAATEPRPIFALPHPSWRNNAWIKKHPFFTEDLLPVLKGRVAQSLAE